MNKCPITYEPCDGDYSLAGLRKLSPRLTKLDPLPFDADGLRQESLLRVGRMSIQGVQTKLSARLEVAKSRFAIVDIDGRFILKTQSNYPELPENEDLTMRLAKACGIEVPLHGLVYAADRSLVYFVKRFDREGRATRLPLEDFAQLAQRTRDTKYDYSMERVASIVEKYCTFPVVEKQKLFGRVIFNFLVGNEDMHLKNYSLLSRKGVVALAPAYDFLNSSIVLRDPEEIALPIDGKKRGLTRKLLVEYWGQDRLRLSQAALDSVLGRIGSVFPRWCELVSKSFLSQPLRDKYMDLIKQRRAVLKIG